jgi:phosphoglycerate dehydrogenase-like enzyme
MRIAILDDYQNVALKMANWSTLLDRAEITVFNDHLAVPSALVERLLPFDIVCVMRERTPLPREVLLHLPRLKLIASTGSRNTSIDTGAAKELGITVTATGYRSSSTIELTWALVLASLRGIVQESNSVRNGSWQKSVGQDLSGKVFVEP